MTDEDRDEARASVVVRRPHPCRGKIDVSAATCYDFDVRWKDRYGAAGVLRANGLTYGRAFLSLYLPDVTDNELATASDERAHTIILERYMGGRARSKT